MLYMIKTYHCIMKTCYCKQFRRKYSEKCSNSKLNYAYSRPKINFYLTL